MFLIKAYFAGDDDVDEEEGGGVGGGDAHYAHDNYDTYGRSYAGFGADDGGADGHHLNVDGSQLSRFLLTFSGEVLFMVFLPSIMFNSGYQLQCELPDSPSWG